jgi:exopolysaccharide biosynthesis protein
VRDPYRPLGEVWAGGGAVRHEPLPESYAPRRACVVSDSDGVRIVARDDAPQRPDGDLLQAGPTLVADGVVVFDPEADHGGSTAAAEQFDSDITKDRYPRAALGLCDDGLVAVACDGRRTNVDAGLSMLELAGVMVDLGAERAINLDGGGSTTLVHRGHLLNRPYSDQDQPAPQTRRVVTALALEPVR